MVFENAASAGKVFAFEPNASVLQILRTNLDLNHVDNAVVVEAACGDSTGTTDFYVAAHHHSSSLHADWANSDGPAQKTTVVVTTLDAFFNHETGRHPPAFIKIDIEGGGTHALPGARRLFAENRPFCLIEFHTPEEDRAISNLLRNFDYRGYRLNDHRWVLNPENTHPDPHGVWGTLVLAPADTTRLCLNSCVEAIRLNLKPLDSHAEALKLLDCVCDDFDYLADFAESVSYFLEAQRKIGGLRVFITGPLCSFFPRLVKISLPSSYSTRTFRMMLSVYYAGPLYPWP